MTDDRRRRPRTRAARPRRAGHRPGRRRGVPRRRDAGALQRAHVELRRPAARPATLTLEVAQHIGDNMVRAISMQPTDGLVRGAEVQRHRRPDLGAGRRRHQGPRLQRPRRRARTSTRARRSTSASAGRIHREAPPFDQLESKTEMFATGIKVIDLLTPYVQRRQDRPVRRCRRRQDRADPGDDLPRRRELRWRVGVRRRRRAHP